MAMRMIRWLRSHTASFCTRFTNVIQGHCPNWIFPRSYGTMTEHEDILVSSLWGEDPIEDPPPPYDSVVTYDFTHRPRPLPR